MVKTLWLTKVEIEKSHGFRRVAVSRISMGRADSSSPLSNFLVSCSKKGRKTSTQNFQYLIEHQFDVFYQNFRDMWSINFRENNVQ